MAPKWSDAVNIKFVKLYKEKRCLWDQHHNLYKNKHAREKALSDIVGEMNIEGFGIVEVKTKIKSLRGTFNIEFAKQQKSVKSGSGSADVYVPTLKWFNIMKEVMVKGTLKRQTTSTLTPDTCENWTGTGDDPLEGTSADNLPPEHDVTANQQDQEPNDMDCAQTTHNQEQISPAYQPKIKLKPRPKFQQIASTAREVKLLSESVSRRSTDENEFDIFGKHVAAQLKMLSPYQAITAEMEINNILTKCRFADLYASPTTASNSPLSD
ncbi:uncharacterized protein [Periplaneta americana]|uniref:uncharacterized protein n=1 Tax=Periplaneta americana TaxID=6978 RepID=UPI0037E95FAD